jgi:hypothetical protein
MSHGNRRANIKGKAMKRLALALTIGSLAGCGNPLDPPQTIGARNAGYTYVALDPLSVQIDTLSRCRPRKPGGPADVLDGLPDIASRVAVRSLSGDANLSAGPVVVGVEGSQYEVVVDYTATDTTNLVYSLPSASTAGRKPNEAELANVERIDARSNVAAGQEKVVVPVYVGVGLRVRARVEVLKGKINLASLGALAAGAQAGRIAGEMTAQTLGVNGAKIGLMVPMQGELNPTTIQNAILSLGSIRAVLYDGETRPTARVTGIYYPFPKSDPATINAIVSELARKPIPWRPCEFG